MHGRAAGRPAGSPDRVLQDTTARDNPRPILCASCRAVVTTHVHAVERGGAHEHTFVNPAGIAFRIRCFSAAGGCRLVGSPTFVHTWFPGFAWRYAFCSTCGTHLGWSYDSADGQSFFGLILDRLMEGGD